MLGIDNLDAKFCSKLDNTYQNTVFENKWFTLFLPKIVEC